MKDEYNIPVAKIGMRILLIKESDLPKIGHDEYVMSVKAQQWDLKSGTLEGEFVLEQLLKFNPWEDVSSEVEKKEILRRLDVLRNVR